MSVGVRVRMNRAGVRQLLRSPEVVADLERRARAIAEAAGDGHEIDSSVGRNRARVEVRTDTPAAKAREAKHRTLTASIDAARR